MIKSLTVLICYRNNFCLVARNPNFRQLVSAMAASKAVVEYAKSGRSTCKECTETIASKSVRLGLVSKDPRGYDATKWHHLNCFPINSDGVGSAEAIEGFTLLKDDDQEAVKKLLDGKSQSREEVQEVDKGGNDDPVVKKKKRKVSEGDEGEDVAKKAKKSTEPEVVVEYAKSGRSSCKKCMKSIATKTLRLGLAAWDPRGYNATKWYHSDCYPLDSVLIASVEEIHGFSSLESNDQEALKKLLNGNPNGGVKVTENDEIDKDDLAENNSKQTKVQEMDEGVNNDSGVKEKKRKVSERDEGENVDTKAKKSTEPEVVVEYAKSGRSSCKKCMKSIATKTLRLGLAAWDPRGYNATKWYHSDCYPLDSVLIASVEEIHGFSSLESNDQEALKKLLNGNPNGGVKVTENDEIDKDDLAENNSKQTKVQEMDEGVNNDSGVKEKKRKVSERDEGENVDTKAKKSTEPEVVVEYAKSGRSSCKKCMKSIATKTLRLGLAAWDPRGYNATKWYHSDCYPLDSVLIASVEEIHGFSSLESNDQEALKKLLNGNPNGGVKVTENDEIDKDDLAENNSKQTKVQEMDEGVNNDSGVKEKKRKVSERDEGENVDKKAKKSTEPEVIVEYAKSGRSSCKTCTESIAAKALRLGLVSWDPRGYSATKWYHSNCYPLDSTLIASVEKINGFSSLESNDQKALKTLLDGNPNCGEKVAEKDQIDKADLEDKNLKQAKLLTPGRAKLEISFSVTDISDKYKDAKLSPKWKAFQTVIFREKDDDLHDSSKIAAFDFDGCLANTDVRRTGADAWSLMYPSIPEKLQSLYREGYKLVIFTNESNIDRWKNKRQAAVDSKIGRLDKFIDLVKVPIQVFIACGVGKSGGKAEDLFRKPNLGMWYLMEQHLNSGIAIDMDKSFYVGDAAGREKDHSDADLKFAQAIGLKFHLPEEYF